MNHPQITHKLTTALISRTARFSLYHALQKRTHPHRASAARYSWIPIDRCVGAAPHTTQYASDTSQNQRFGLDTT
jgi:hypothetical protein